MKSILALVVLLLASQNALAQKSWSGYASDPAYASVPNRPPVAVCVDGSFLYQDNAVIKDDCRRHGGVKQYVSMQYVDLDGRILREAPRKLEATPAKPQENLIPEFWQKPITLDVPKEKSSASPIAPMFAKGWIRRTFTAPHDNNKLSFDWDRFKP